VLPFQRLDVYQVAMQFLALAHSYAGRCPSAHKELADQLRRAALSIPLNISEGNGKIGRDSRRYYQAARGSVMECGCAVDACLTFGLISAEERESALALLDRLVAMLTRMARG
jgi:four helix bundle protein